MKPKEQESGSSLLMGNILAGLPDPLEGLQTLDWFRICLEQCSPLGATLVPREHFW